MRSDPKHSTRMGYTMGVLDRKHGESMNASKDVCCSTFPDQVGALEFSECSLVSTTFFDPCGDAVLARPSALVASGRTLLVSVV